MEQFFALTPDSGAGEMPRKQALETVRNNIEWMQRNKDEIKGWLDKNIEWTTLKLSGHVSPVELQRSKESKNIQPHLVRPTQVTLNYF